MIGVVTSPTGAVIRDILHRVGERFPCRVLVWPVRVQGDGAAAEIAAAIEGFNRLGPDTPAPRPDVLIVARGGGSIEDLWAFNEEVVVRAAAASGIPLIAAVGHETDVTLIDFAADVRAPTPTAAAEMAVPVRIDLHTQVTDAGRRLLAASRRILEERRVRLQGLARGLPNLRRMTEDAAQRLDDWSERLEGALRVGLERRRARIGELARGLAPPKRRIELAGSRIAAESRALARAVQTLVGDRRQRLREAGRLLESGSYRRVLKRGFALIADAHGRSVRSVSALAPGAAIGLTFHDGRIGAVVDEAGGGTGAAPGRQGPRTKGRAADGRQGKLL